MIYVDIDGVMANFHKGVCKLHDRDYEEIMSFVEKGNYYWMPKAFGMSNTQFWKAIDGAGTEFWSELEPYPWMDDLIELAGKDFFISTSPGLCPYAPTGKVEWLRKKFGKSFNRFSIGSYKHLLARWDSVLIDDSDKKCKKFQEIGTAILFPQPWNANHKLVDDKLGYVKQELENVRRRIATT